jgi:hypothetical protein
VAAIDSVACTSAAQRLDDPFGLVRVKPDKQCKACRSEMAPARETGPIAAIIAAFLLGADVGAIAVLVGQRLTTTRAVAQPTQPTPEPPPVYVVVQMVGEQGRTVAAAGTGQWPPLPPEPARQPTKPVFA